MMYWMSRSQCPNGQDKAHNLAAPLPAGWKETKSIYLDADSCRYSEIEPPKQSGDFIISSKPWTPNVEGKIIYAMAIEIGFLQLFVAFIN
jgi:hypothetical protein